MKNFYKTLSSASFLIMLITICAEHGSAQIVVPANQMLGDTLYKSSGVKKSGEDDQISTKLIAGNNNAIFENSAHFTFEVKNAATTTETGKVSYTVLTEAGQPLMSDSVKITLSKKTTGRYTFNIPESKPGFYKINFMVNVSDYDDTTRRAFGIRPQAIQSPYKKPADFDLFWQNSKTELAATAPDFKVTPAPDKDTENCNVYLIEMNSLDNVRIRGWMTVPKKQNKRKKFAVVLALPGYQVDLCPITGEDPDVAFITLNTRGQGNSRDQINTRHDEFIVRHIEDKDKYVMRGVIMDCIRCVDFICSRPELNHEQIFVKGGSMGAYLALATASLDNRISLCSAQSPILCDVRNLQGRVEFPIKNINRYLETQPGLSWNKILDNLDYFDGKTFAQNIHCKVIMSIGLVDNYAPPSNEYAAFNNINAPKRILVFKDLGHDVSPLYLKLESAWMHDEFALF
ncbi:MAG: acetylxylan esterase [Mucilaginibacter sp.]